MKYQIQKNLAAGMTGLMLLSCLTGCGAVPVNTEAEAASEERQETEAAPALLSSSSGEMSKEETVYVIANPDGTPEETIVSAWLKNPDGNETITDCAELSDIENVKGTETYTVDKNGNIVWQADGSDIYYQGISQQELPVSTEISYMLDGKTVSAEELPGASGHLVITFTYKNNTATERAVEGKTITLYQPFLVLSGLVLDNTKASDVTVTKGMVMNTGDQMIAIGMAMPGLPEDLDLDDLKDTDGNPITLDIPETVTIEADVTDFSLLTTVTIIENSLFNSLNLDDVETLDDLQDAVDQLTSASSQLVEGTGELYDGVSRLSDGSDTLSSGIDTLDSGADELNAGAAALADGTNTLKEGAANVSNNMSILSVGLDSLNDGAQSLYNALEGMQAQVADLPDNVDALYTFALQIKAALEGSLYEGAASMETGADALFAGLENIGSAADNMQVAAEGIGSSAGNISGSASAIYDLLASLQTEENAGTIEAIYGYLSTISSNAAAISATAGSISDGSATISSGSKELKAGADNLADGAGDLKTGIAAAANYLDNLAKNLSLMADSSQTLVDGVDQLSVGAQDLSAGAGNAAAGAKQLSEGTQQLATGASDAADGASKLADGASVLKEGTVQLKDGSTALIDGISQLLSGAQQLKEGLVQFDSDGIQKLASVLEDNGQALLARLRALQDLSEEYTSFSGAGGDLPCSVRFIVRTNSIGG